MSLSERSNFCFFVSCEIKPLLTFPSQDCRFPYLLVANLNLISLCFNFVALCHCLRVFLRVRWHCDRIIVFTYYILIIHIQIRAKIRQKFSYKPTSHINPHPHKVTSPQTEFIQKLWYATCTVFEVFNLTWIVFNRRKRHWWELNKC